MNKVMNPRNASIAVKVGLAALVLVMPYLLPNQYFVQVLDLICIFILLGTELNLLLGYTGQISLGQAAFFGIGAYVAALLNTTFNLPFLVVLPAAMLVAALFGVILAIPALKVKGSYLALVTIGFGEIIRMVLVNWIEVTKGPSGIVGIQAPSLFGFEFATLDKYYYLILFFVVIGFWYQQALVHSRTGRAFIAIREDDQVAELTGINITEYKIKAFVLSAVYSAVAGVLYAMMIRYVSPDSFTANDSSIILWTVCIGGMGSLFGSILGATVMIFLPELLRSLGDMRLVINGVILLIVIIRYPGGLTPYVEKLVHFVEAKLWRTNPA